MPGVLTGKQTSNSIYVPSIYSKSQSDWVDSFYKQNGYLGVFNLKIFYLRTLKHFLSHNCKSHRRCAINFFVTEYDALARLGISDGQTFARKHFPGEKLLLLNSAAVGPMLLGQVEAAVEEAVSSGTWVDIMVRS